MVSAARKLELVEKALDRLSPLEASCTLCPRACRTDRTKGAAGICQTGSLAAVSHDSPTRLPGEFGLDALSNLRRAELPLFLSRLAEEMTYYSRSMPLLFVWWS